MFVLQQDPCKTTTPPLKGKCFGLHVDNVADAPVFFVNVTRSQIFFASFSVVFQG